MPISYPKTQKEWDMWRLVLWTGTAILLFRKGTPKTIKYLVVGVIGYAFLKKGIQR